MSSNLARPVVLVGAALLLHACYSAYEHSKINDISSSASHTRSTQSLSPITAYLPLDVSLETVVSVFFVCLGLVLGAEELQPISWRVWAGKRDSGGGGPFQNLEERMGFLDIRAKRKEFADWVRNEGAGEEVT